MTVKKVLSKKKSGRLLSWHKGVKQWYLTIPYLEGEQEGTKRKYFGTGKGVSDTQSYRKAL